MQVEDVHTVGPELLQARVEVLCDVLRKMFAGLIGVHLGRDGQTSLLPSCVASECFLFAANCA